MFGTLTNYGQAGGGGWSGQQIGPGVTAWSDPGQSALWNLQRGYSDYMTGGGFQQQADQQQQLINALSGFLRGGRGGGFGVGGGGGMPPAYMTSPQMSSIQRMGQQAMETTADRMRAQGATEEAVQRAMQEIQARYATQGSEFLGGEWNKAQDRAIDWAKVKTMMMGQIPGFMQGISTIAGGGGYNPFASMGQPVSDGGGGWGGGGGTSAQKQPSGATNPYALSWTGKEWQQPSYPPAPTWSTGGVGMYGKPNDYMNIGANWYTK